MQIDKLVMDSLVNKLSNLDAENVVLGAILLEKNCYYTVADKLQEDMFSHTINQHVYRAIKEISNEKGNEIDSVTVFDKMVKNNSVAFLKRDFPEVGIPGYLIGLTNKVASTIHITYHIGILEGYRKLRRIRKLTMDMDQMCVNIDDPDEIINHITNELDDIANSEVDEFDQAQTIQDSVNSMKPEALGEIVKTGVHQLDEKIYGFELGDFIVLAGAASMGKTAAAMRLFDNWIEAGLNPSVFSREMRAVQLTNRIMAMRSGVALSKIRQRKLSPNDQQKINAVAQDLMKNKFFIDDKTKDLYKICAKIRKQRYKHGTKVFIIDYLQLVSVNLGKNVNREREVATITRVFKETALDLDVVIIGLSQLSRIKRDDKRPLLSDLRESGAIEQDADMVIFPYRPAYYDVFQKSIPPTEDAEWIIAKGRGTGLHTIPMKFRAYITNYLNGSPSEPEWKEEDIEESF